VLLNKEADRTILHPLFVKTVVEKWMKLNWPSKV